jgi:hypothetical protein
MTSAKSETNFLIDAWEVRLLRALQDSELDTGTAPGELNRSPTLRQVAARLREISPSTTLDVMGRQQFSASDQLRAFIVALARTMDHMGRRFS